MPSPELPEKNTFDKSLKSQLSRSDEQQYTMASAAYSSIEPFLKGTTGRNTRGLLRVIILCTIAAAAVSSRLFSVISTWRVWEIQYGAGS